MQDAHANDLIGMLPAQKKPRRGDNASQDNYGRCCLKTPLAHDSMLEELEVAIIPSLTLLSPIVPCITASFQNDYFPMKRQSARAKARAVIKSVKD
jgi:hypothetical protein